MIVEVDIKPPLIKLDIRHDKKKNNSQPTRYRRGVPKTKEGHI